MASPIEHVPPLPDFSRFHDAFRAGPDTPEGDIRSAFFLAYDEDNCDYLDLDDRLSERLEAGRNWSPPRSSSPIRRAFRSWCRGR
ncbi:MAG: hypothetical protein R3D84_07980 [Paracoccaceae bacterium]